MNATADRELAIQMALQRACLLRGEAMDEIRLDAYAEEFAERFADSAVTLAWLKRFGAARREEFEPRIPELGEALHLLQRAHDEVRWERQRAARNSAASEEVSRAEELERDRLRHAAWKAGQPEGVAQREAKRLQARRPSVDLKAAPEEGGE